MQCVIQNIYGTFLYMVHWGIFYIQTQQNIENWIEYRKQYAHGFTIRLLCYFFCYWKKTVKKFTELYDLLTKDYGWVQQNWALINKSGSKM